MRPSLRLPAAIVAAIVVAEAGVLLLRPRDLGPEPSPVQARAYFSERHLSRAQDFRRGQTALFGVRLAIELGVLVLLVRRPPRIKRVAARPVATGAAVGAIAALAIGLAPLPVRAISRERAKDVGLVTQSWTGWLGDVAKAEAISATFAAAGGALLIVVVRRFRSRWWIPGTGAVVAFGVFTIWLAPVVLDPLFNKFEKLPDGRVRSDVFELAQRSGVDVGEVYDIDASRRTTGANAYVTGIGHTKRVVLYDNLLEDFEPAEVRSVVAHELAHVAERDVRDGVVYFVLVAPFGMLAGALLAQRLGLRPGRDVDAARAVPAAALALALLAPALTTISNQLSRDVERRADYRALEATRDPDALIALQRRLSETNVGDPDPPGWTHWLLGSHPSTLERIGRAEAFKRE